MTTVPGQNKAELVVLVNRYFTPFALLLVGMGLALSQPKAWIAYSCVGILIFSFAFNQGTAFLVRASGSVSWQMAFIRLYTNLAVNVVLVYLLGGFWEPIWLLFVLTPVATALYGERRQVLSVAGGVAGLLLVTHGLRQLNAPVDWGKPLVEAIFILFLSLFVHDLSRYVRGSANPA
jgi:hypothetical protein